MSLASKPRIAIVGAGIGGLTAGILLQRAGYRISIYEQSDELGEVGAGLTLSRGAQATLQEAGVLPEVQAASMVSAKVPFLHYRSAALLGGAYDHGDGSGDPKQLVGRQIHRADLHAILAGAFARTAGALHLGRRLRAVESHGSSATLTFRDGAEEADLVIGADGLRSMVRETLMDPAPPLFAHQVAWRFLLPWAAAAPFMNAGRAAVYFGPELVLNRYTLRRGEIVNVVALARSEQWVEEGWSVGGDPAELQALFKGWHPDVVGLVGQAAVGSLRRWGLFHRDPLPAWRRGAVSLLGDAAHPMLPFLGLGAAMAIEDAMILTRAFEASPDPRAALDLYETVRKPRTAEVYRQSVRQGELLQSRDPDHYDGTAAPAADPAFFAYDPVTAPLAAG